MIANQVAGLFAGAVPPVPYSTVILGDNPIGFWQLNETSGTTMTDSSTTGLNGTYYNTPSLNQSGTGGGITKSVYFDGASSENGYTNTTSTYYINAASNWSMEIWFKDNSTGVSSIESMFAWRGDTGEGKDTLGIFTLNNGSAGRVQLITTSDIGISGNAIILGYDRTPDTNWHYLAATAVSGGAVKLYLDGSEVASSTAARWNSANYNKRAVIASNWSSGTPVQFTTGNLACAAVYNTTLSSTKITDHYNAGKP